MTDIEFIYLGPNSDQKCHVLMVFENMGKTVINVPGAPSILAAWSAYSQWVESRYGDATRDQVRSMLVSVEMTRAGWVEESWSVMGGYRASGC